MSFLTFFSGGGGVRLRQILDRRGVHAVFGEYAQAKKENSDKKIRLRTQYFLLKYFIISFVFYFNFQKKFKN